MTIFSPFNMQHSAFNIARSLFPGIEGHGLLILNFGLWTLNGRAEAMSE
jgi:hypothetical protein